MAKTDYKKKKSPLMAKTFLFAIRIIKLNSFLTEQKREFVISKQITRSGTNPGAMVREADHAESGPDFIHKLAVAQKETGETQYWLELLHATAYLTDAEFDSLYADTEEIMKMLTSSIKTKKKNMALKTISILILLSAPIIYLLTTNH